jgi:hypothetical protein
MGCRIPRVTFRRRCGDLALPAARERQALVFQTSSRQQVANPTEGFERYGLITAVVLSTFSLRREKKADESGFILDSEWIRTSPRYPEGYVGWEFAFGACRN